MDKNDKALQVQNIPWLGGDYSGQLENSMPNGWGRLQMPDGQQFVGEWKAGKPNGSGTIILSNGGIYKGEFINGKRHGHGRYTEPGGKIIEGLWENGQYIKPFKQLKREVIKINALTFRYGSGKGVFDLSFSVGEGEVFGYLGPNGSGKTTTIRNLLGFVKPGRGTCSINGLDCWHSSAQIQKQLGYLPGEISFFDEMSGIQFLDLIGAMRGINKKSHRNALINRFELDPSAKIRRMSKGMKQKLGLVTAFMHDPAVYILDEPTSGLDPLMQNVFVDLILEEKERGKTILMSSHSFEETYRTCDRAGIIREGRLVAVEDVHSLKSSQHKAYLVTLESIADLEYLRSAGLKIGSISKNTVEVFVSGNYDQFIAALAKCKIHGLDVATQSLEQVFLKYYGREGSS
jgi:ABC-2 type transport system ATP-binding protein